MFWLPRELIDYIWSFDDNIINKTKYNKCMKEVQFLRSRRHTISWFSIQKYNHATYLNCTLSRNERMGINIEPEYSKISKYIIEWNNRFGNAVSLDTIEFYKPSKIIQNPKLKQLGPPILEPF